MKKDITVELVVDFPDDFVPPVECNPDLDRDDACMDCPFYYCIDNERDVYECSLVGHGKCPINKYFERDLISKKTKESNTEYYTYGLQFERTKEGYFVTEITTNATDVIIPSVYQGLPVIGIADRAFYCNNDILTVKIPDSVTIIDDGAFSGCSNMTSIVIPDSVTSIGKHAFMYCSNLRNITIPAGVTRLDRYTFDGCNKLRSVTFKDTNNWFKSDLFGNKEAIDVSDAFENSRHVKPSSNFGLYKI